MDAIKASIDADLVRESHKLNSQMVLLTIAISGGPFLGLLGTFWGLLRTIGSVGEIIGRHFPYSVKLGLLSIVFATIFGTAMGVVAAARRNTWADYALYQTYDLAPRAIAGFDARLIARMSRRWTASSSTSFCESGLGADEALPPSPAAPLAPSPASAPRALRRSSGLSL